MVRWGRGRAGGLGVARDRTRSKDGPVEAEPIQPRSDAAETIPFERAASRLAAAAAAARARGPVVIVGITGPVGAGKSLLASRLSACVIGTDHYLPDYATVPFGERDLPRHADLSALAGHLASLRTGRAADVPVWSFQTHRREASRRVAPAPLIVCEGIHALEGEVLPHLDVRVYVEAPAAVRWQRWEALERSGERGWGAEHAREHFERVAEPTFALAAERYREAADFIVLNG